MDRELVIRARDGDHDAFADLVTRSIGRLTALARLILRDEFRAQDAVQDAYVEAWRDLRSLREPERFEAWLRRILVRSCYRRARAERQLRSTEIRLVNASVAGDRGQGADAGSVETRDELERGLRRLSVEQRAVLVLTYYLDLPQDEAAAALGVPLGTLKSRSNRAMQALRAALDADAREPRFAQEPVR